MKLEKQMLYARSDPETTTSLACLGVLKVSLSACFLILMLDYVESNTMRSSYSVLQAKKL